MEKEEWTFVYGDHLDVGCPIYRLRIVAILVPQPCPEGES